MKNNLAIAYSMKRKAKKMAEGGDVEETLGSAIGYPGFPKPKPSPVAKPMFNGGAVAPEYNYEENEQAIHEDDMGLNQHMVTTGSDPFEAEVNRIMEQEDPTFESEARLANGGMLGEAGSDAHDDKVRNRDMFQDKNLVDRIMQRRQMMSEGGQVANATPPIAGAMPNEFDDLVLRDDLSSSYGLDDNAGDSLGNAQEDEDRADIIARIMRSRAKKDKLPKPA